MTMGSGTTMKIIGIGLVVIGLGLALWGLSIIWFCRFTNNDRFRYREDNDILHYWRCQFYCWHIPYHE